MNLFLNQLFGNRISAFFGLDVIVSAAVLMTFVYSDDVRIGVRK
jgi:hypothetical protein